MSYVLVEFLLDKTQPVVSSDDVRDFSGVVEDDKVYQVYWADDARTKGSFYDAKVLYMAGCKQRGLHVPQHVPPAEERNHGCKQRGLHVPQHVPPAEERNHGWEQRGLHVPQHVPPAEERNHGCEQRGLHVPQHVPPAEERNHATADKDSSNTSPKKNFLGAHTDTPADSVGIEDEETDEGNPQGENKYIVYESCLLERFKVCVTCLAPCKPSLSLSGSCLTVLTECCNGDRHSWSSQPYVGRKPAGNIDLCAGILFSGSSPAPALRMMRLMNLRVISERTFHEYQEAYLLPAVQTVWESQRDEHLAALAGAPMDLSGDGRCDSPGHSAKFLTYSFYSNQLGKILPSELVRVKECPEASASSKMENEGCIREIAFLKSRDVIIRSFTTDRHSAIKAHMRLHEPTILHLFDVWNAVKGLRKKLTAASKTAGCKDLTHWVNPVCNHLWWCTNASGGDGELLTAVWLSVTNHVCDVHVGHGPVYPRCMHKDLGEKQWIAPGL
ncbi:uncharacterized protein ISCGN_003490 [Ixodes scapularis]